MSKKYRSGFERLTRQAPDTDTRYKIALEAVRENFKGFEEFNGYDEIEQLTDSQRKQIRRYYNTLTEYTEGGPVYKMAPEELPAEILEHGSKGIDAVMRAAQMRTGRHKSRFIFVRFDGDQIPKVKLRNDTPVFVNDRFGYEKEFIPLSPAHLAENARATIENLAPLVEGARYFRIANGRHEFYRTNSLRLLADEIIRLQNKYAIGSKDAWTRWLSGVLVYYTEKDAITTMRYIRESREKFAEKVKREAKKLRRKRK